jgi:hypothetical protein
MVNHFVKWLRAFIHCTSIDRDIYSQRDHSDESSFKQMKELFSFVSGVKKGSFLTGYRKKLIASALLK